LADQFSDEAYASVKGRVRTYVLHQQLMEHLPAPPAPVLDVGGGAGHQSFPLAQAGYDVTLLDPSSAMLDKARQRLRHLPGEAQRRVTLLQADGENAGEAVNARRFAAVLCHGVLGYLEQPEPLVDQLCERADAGGVVSIMAGNAKAMAVRPALERRWDDALASFDATDEIGILGVPTRADTVEDLSELLRSGGVEPVRWYGVWLLSTGWISAGPSWTSAIQSSWRPRPRSNLKPADETLTANSVVSSISWDAKVRVDRTTQQRASLTGPPGRGRSAATTFVVGHPASSVIRPRRSGTIRRRTGRPVSGRSPGQARACRRNRDTTTTPARGAGRSRRTPWP
jgi:SAM-dependent methyltransferase